MTVPPSDSSSVSSSPGSGPGPSESPSRRISSLGLVLPKAAAPAANYVPYVRTGASLYVSGQLPFRDGKLVATGLVEDEVSVSVAQEAARWCALNILAQVQAGLGELPDGLRLIRLGGWVACGASFTQHPAVLNGASDLMMAVLGENGRHVRVALGASSLPLGACVEIEALFRL